MKKIIISLLFLTNVLFAFQWENIESFKLRPTSTYLTSNFAEIYIRNEAVLTVTLNHSSKTLRILKTGKVFDFIIKEDKLYLREKVHPSRIEAFRKTSPYVLVVKNKIDNITYKVETYTQGKNFRIEQSELIMSLDY